MAKRSEYKIEMEVDNTRPIYLNLANTIIRDIERGRLRPGDSLPGTRSLAKSLKLNRNTIDAAFHELIMQGWIVSEPSRGTFISQDLPEIKPSRKKVITPPLSPEHLKLERQKKFLLKTSEGSPDSRLMPVDELARALRKAFSKTSLFLESEYGDAKGVRALRNTLADYLILERGLVASAENIMVTRGSQMGLFLSALAIIRPGDVIAVEDPGYRLAWSAFRAAGAKVVGINVDEQGIDVEELALLAQREPNLKAVYTTPHHQYPTTVTLSAGRRLKLLELARRHQFTIIEDDYDHEYRFDASPVLPLAARAKDNQSIIYLGSFSKLLSPVVRVGYVVAPPEILEKMASCRESIDRHGDTPLEDAIASIIEDGELSRNTRKASRIYEQRRNLLVNELEKKLSSFIDFEIPSGGLALWIRVREGISAEEWARKAAEIGLFVLSGSNYSLTSKVREAFRIGFADLEEGDIKRLVTMLLKSKPS